MHGIVEKVFRSAWALCPRGSASLWTLPLILLVAAAACAQSNVSAVKDGSTSSLYAQAATVMLDRSFPSPRIEYLLLDAQSREVIAERWPHADTPIAPGSLLKPFVALAYARSQQKSSPNRSQQAALTRGFPSIVCHGKSDGCWRPGGHGQLALEQALAVSCNAYFLALARDVTTNGDALHSVSARYGLPDPPANTTASMLIGVTPDWRVTPLALARAYALLIAGADTREVVEDDPIDYEAAARLREGMRMAALPGGTAAKAGVHPGGVLAKTGTASCVPDFEEPALAGHGKQGQCRINGDGLVVLAAPQENPRWLLLVRERGTTGAMTAEIAGEMLTRLEETDGTQR
jgi:cell division protein FtsI/penicillin-binding protein 2